MSFHLSTAAVALAISTSVAFGAKPVPTAATAVVSVFYEGLYNPRGLKFGPDGNLYVAEGGTGGSNPVPADCDATVIPPIGPYTGSQDGARISKIDTSGIRTTVVSGLPSSQTQPLPTPLVSGVADVAFIGETLYAVLAGAGCSHGVTGIPNGVIRVNPPGAAQPWTLIADHGAYQRANPVKNPEEDDFEPDGTWYSMIAVRGDLYAVEPNHGELVRISPQGDGSTIRRVADLSAQYGHIVPTAIAYHGDFYIGNLAPFGVAPGSSKIYKVTPSGSARVDSAGFTTVLGVAFDRRARMYVLENSRPAAAPVVPTPNTGRVVRVDPSGRTEVVADQLNLPTAMTFGPDGNLYVSNLGFGPPPQAGAVGQILKIELAD